MSGISEEEALFVARIRLLATLDQTAEPLRELVGDLRDLAATGVGLWPADNEPSLKLAVAIEEWLAAIAALPERSKHARPD